MADCPICKAKWLTAKWPCYLSGCQVALGSWALISKIMIDQCPVCIMSCWYLGRQKA